MQDYVIIVEGLSGLFNPDALDKNIVRSAQQAINRTADRTRTRSERDMQSRINFKAQYLRRNLKVTKRASATSLEAVITGRDRPTSLARFATTKSIQASRKQGGVTVQVSPGKTHTIPRAFLMQLKNGNVGLAIRLKPGESINKRVLKRMSNGLYLLFGPSVDQVFRNVAENETPDALDFLEREFVRLMEL